MCRKNRFTSSILFRISAWILFFGAASIFFVTDFMKTQMRNNIEKQVTEEMLRVRDNSELYVRQLLLLNDCQIDGEGFEECAEEIEEQLKSAGYHDVALYNLEGSRLTEGGLGIFDGEKRKDFMRALENESAFTLRYGKKGKCEAYFTMPVNFMGKPVGIISYFFDYQEVYEREWDTVSGIIHVSVSAFAIICIVIWMIIYRMVSPIRKLSRATGDISEHLADGQFDSSIIENLKFDRRKDEIGELFQNYMQMLKVVMEQFEKIRKDKEHILKLWSSRQEFYNNVTHELKTPLTTISGYAQLIEENGLSDEELFRGGMEHIRKESVRLYGMVVQLLEMQDRAAFLETERLDLAELLRNVAGSMQMKAKRYGSAVVAEGDAERYPINGHPDRIRQVLINLIDNAIKYGETGEEVRLRIYRRNQSVQIDVCNKGRGIEKEELDNIFEPFYRAGGEQPAELGSSGLGLAISKKIIEEHGGDIRAVSQPGGETVFTVRFPEDGK